ncbi:MAG: right-handed parallel beta-helix repeat-containing protein [Polyangiaceae bacterium]
MPLFPQLAVLAALSALSAALGLFGCSEAPGPDAAAAGSGGSPPAAACVAGELTLEDGACAPAGLPADAPCQPGEIVTGDGACAPAGVAPGACAEGFAADGVAGCTPILPTRACSAGHFALPGEVTCRPVTPCAPGTWGDIPVDAQTEFVDASYDAPDADGSSERPFPTIQAAIAAAEDGAIVAIAAGSYTEDLDITGKSVRLWGRCPELVEVVGSGAEVQAVLVRPGADGTEVRALAITGAAAGVGLSGAEDVHIDGVWIHDTTDRGIAAQDDLGPTSLLVTGSLLERTSKYGLTAAGSKVSLEWSVIRGTRSNAQGRMGVGIMAMAGVDSDAGAVVTVRSAVIEDNHEFGVLAEGAAVDMEASVVRGTLEDGEQSWGVGVGVQRSSMLTLRTSVIDRNHAIGVFVASSVATVEDSVIRDTQPSAAHGFGRGLSTEMDPQTGQMGDVTVRRSLVERNHSAGVHVSGSAALLEGVVIRDTSTSSNGDAGRGISVQGKAGQRANLVLRGALVERNEEMGIFVLASDATIESTVVRDTLASASIPTGWGINIQHDPESGVRSSALIQSSLVERSAGVGLLLIGADATVERSEIRDTGPDVSGALGRGINVQWPTVASLRGVLVERSREMGIAVLGADASLEGVLVRDTEPNGDGRFGDGIAVAGETGPARADLVSSRVESSARAGLANFGALVMLEDSMFACSGFDLEGEPYLGAAFQFQHRGGTVCGCPAEEECQVHSGNIEPAKAIGPSPATP